MHHSRLCAVLIDCNTPDVDVAARFWGEALGAQDFAQRTGCVALGETEQAQVARTSERAAYKRAMKTCQATKAWAAKVASQLPQARR
jgi:hypothetical protein